MLRTICLLICAFLLACSADAVNDAVKQPMATGGVPSSSTATGGAAGVQWACGPVLQGSDVLGCACLISTPNATYPDLACGVQWSCCLTLTESGVSECQCLNADCPTLAKRFAEAGAKVVASCP